MLQCTPVHFDMLKPFISSCLIFMLLKVQFKILCYMVVYLGLGKKKKRKKKNAWFWKQPLKTAQWFDPCRG